MQRIDGRFIYAASDLNNYLQCKRLSELDALVARGRSSRAAADDDERAQLIRRKGEEHERDTWRACWRATAATRRAVRALRSRRRDLSRGRAADARGDALGRPDHLSGDVLRRTVHRPRRFPAARRRRRRQLGDWSYEVIDTKLALSPKPYYLVQLCNYSEHLERCKGVMPRVRLHRARRRQRRALSAERLLRRTTGTSRPRFWRSSAIRARDTRTARDQYPHQCQVTAGSARGTSAARESASTTII